MKICRVFPFLSMESTFFSIPTVVLEIIYSALSISMIFTSQCDSENENPCRYPRLELMGAEIFLDPY